MFARLLAIFLITPVIELALLIQLGNRIGFWPTIAIIIATGFAGTYLARREGFSAWKRFNARLRAGELPGRELLDGVIILVAGALLITPGVLTDLAGFVGLIPPTRAFIRRRLSTWIQRKTERRAAQSFAMNFDFASTFESESTAPPPPSGDLREHTEWKGDRRERPEYRDSERP